ncbi:hypothetical protein KJ940_15740 [Myxococcota bacterium]|nr:hypothetical protein [Myxococcota bacterium]
MSNISQNDLDRAYKKLKIRSIFIVFVFLFINIAMFIDQYSHNIKDYHEKNQAFADDLKIFLFGYLNKNDYESVTRVLEKTFSTKKDLTFLKVSSIKNGFVLFENNRDIRIKENDLIRERIEYGYDGLILFEFSSESNVIKETIRSVLWLIIISVMVSIILMQIFFFNMTKEQFKIQEKIHLNEHLRKLENKNNELEARNEKLDEFSYVIAHSLTSSLRVIDSYSYLLEEEFSSTLNHNAVKFIEKIKKASNQIFHLINSLVSSVHLETNDVNFKKVNINQVISDVKVKINSSFSIYDVKIESNHFFYDIECDRILIEEVFYQLILNGIVFNDKDNKSIKISFLDDVNGPIFYIIDNGIGIENEYLDKIFNVFMKIRSEPQYNQGVGMGLSIVKKIIEQHHGWIKVYSEEGIGSVFYFQLFSNDEVEIDNFSLFHRN